MWVPLRTLWKAGGPWRGLVVLCFFFLFVLLFFFLLFIYLKPAEMCYNSRKEKLSIKTDLSQTTEFLGLISTAFKQIVDIFLEGKIVI